VLITPTGAVLIAQIVVIVSNEGDAVFSTLWFANG